MHICFATGLQTTESVHRSAVYDLKGDPEHQDTHQTDFSRVVSSTSVRLERSPVPDPTTDCCSL